MVTDNSLKNIGLIKKLLLFILPFFILLSYFFAYYPGCFSPDSFSYLYDFNDSHPVLFLMYFRGISYVLGNSGYIILNLIFLSLLIGRSSLFFIKMGFSYWATLAFALIFSFLPPIGLMIVTVWKDIIFALAILYLTLILIESRVRRNGDRANKYYYIELLIALVFILGSRHNGIVTVLFTFVILFFDKRQKRQKLIIVLVVSLLVQFLAFFVAFNYLGAKKGWISMDHVLLRHLTVYLHEGKLDSSGVRLLVEIMPLQAYEHGFSYYTHDGLAFGPYGKEYRDIDKIKKQEIRKAFFRNVISSPSTFIKSEMLVSEILWSPIPLKGSFRLTYCKNCGQGLNKQLNKFYQKLVLITDSNQFRFYSRYLFWSGALNVWLIVIMIVIVYFRAGFYYIVPMLPVLGNTLSLFISVISQDYRYVYCEVLVSALLIPYFLWIFLQKRKKSPLIK